MHSYYYILIYAVPISLGLSLIFMIIGYPKMNRNAKKYKEE